MKKYFSITVLLFLAYFNLNSQSSDIVPPSPVTVEFNKYLNFDVTLYHGIPEISIPLYSIKLKDLTIPINLSYHASGIKYGQGSGNVGLGWVINPGYRISRTIYGYADDAVSMLPDVEGSLSEIESKAVNEVDRDKFLSKFVPALGNNFYIDPSKESVTIDGEYDQFSFLTPKDGGNFIITDRNRKIIQTMTESNLKIDYKTGKSQYFESGGIIGFQIKDPQGIKYAFGEYYSTSSFSMEYIPQYGINNIVPALAWGISEIITPLCDSVKFKYTLGQVGESTLSYNKNYQITNADPSDQTSRSRVDYIYNDAESYYNTIYPSQIVTPNEKILFNHTTSANKNKLNSIKILSTNGDIIKQINFYYHDGYYSYSAYYLLDSITVSGKNEKDNVETYRFEYYPKPGLSNDQNNVSRDQWGYIVEGNIDNYFHDSFKEDPLLIQETADECVQAYANERILGIVLPDNFFTNKELKPESKVPDYFSLKKITYPTGGHTEYEYENNLYSETYPGNVFVSGIRIKRIRSFDPVKKDSLVHYYKYGINECGYGQSSFIVNHDLFVNEKLLIKQYKCSILEHISAQRIISYSTNMQGDAESDVFKSGFVRYPQVTEYFSSNLGNGKIEYFFNIGEPYKISPLSNKNIVPNGVYNDFFPINISEYNLWDKPYLEQKSIFNQNGKPLRIETYQYRKNISLELSGLKVRSYASFNSYEVFIKPLHYYNDDGKVLNSFFDYGFYSISIGNNLLVGKTIRDYVNDSIIQTNYSYEYSNLLLSKETFKNSKGEKYIYYSSYPLDYADGVSFIDNLKTQGLIGYPIEKVSFLDKGSEKRKIISGSIIRYKSGGKGLIDSQWNLESTSPLDLNSFKFSNRNPGIIPNSGNATTFFPDANYSKKITFDKYDFKGNPTQVHKEHDFNVSYLWGYNHTYPVAKVEGASYDEIINLVDTAKLNNPANDEILRNELNKLRTSDKMKGTIISTYTYKPLIGMTSQTDSNGVTTYYEYDGFGRLTFIRDHDGNILKTYDYHYKGQSK